MAKLKNPSVYGRFSFDFEDDERLLHKVTNVTIDTGNPKLDSFLARVPEGVWCSVAENILQGITDEAIRDIRRGDFDPDDERAWWGR